MKLSLGLFFLIYFVPGIVLGADTEGTFLRIERSKQTESGLRITAIGGFGLKGRKVGHVDLSYIESVNNGDGLAMDIGADFAIRAGVTFFVGGGFLLGYNWDKSDYIAAYYPEAGIIVNITKTFGVTVSRKRYFNLYDRTENVTMIGFLFGAL